jgi:hypothetical protein
MPVAGAYLCGVFLAMLYSVFLFARRIVLVRTAPQRPDYPWSAVPAGIKQQKGKRARAPGESTVLERNLFGLAYAAVGLALFTVYYADQLGLETSRSLYNPLRHLFHGHPNFHSSLALAYVVTGIYLIRASVGHLLIDRYPHFNSELAPFLAGITATLVAAFTISDLWSLSTFGDIGIAVALAIGYLLSQTSVVADLIGIIVLYSKAAWAYVKPIMMKLGHHIALLLKRLYDIPKRLPRLLAETRRKADDRATHATETAADRIQSTVQKLDRAEDDAKRRIGDQPDE